MKTSEELFGRAKKRIPGGVNSPVRAFRSVGGTPFFTEKAEGSRLITVDGDNFIDYVCTWGPAIHGHNHPEIKNAIANALEKGTSFGTPNPYEPEMAELVCELVPSIEKVRMCNSGTEATMSCIRLARGFTSRNKIIKFEGCYHGHVDALLVKAGSGALTLGNPDSAGIPESFAKETIVLPLNDTEALEEAFKTHGSDIAGIIIEPYPANVSLIIPDTVFLQKLRDLCDGNNSILIFDEVMTGFRVDIGGVQKRTGVTPDLTALGKIIGGGLPVGAFGGKKEIMDYLAPDGPVYQAGTLSGNPLAMAAGITALKILKEESPYSALQEKANVILKAVNEAAKEKGTALQTPNVGSMFALFFTDKEVSNFSEAISTNVDNFKSVFRHALNNGVYLAPSAYETCFISTAHSNDDIERTAEILSEGIKNI